MQTHISFSYSLFFEPWTSRIEIALLKHAESRSKIYSLQVRGNQDRSPHCMAEALQVKWVSALKRRHFSAHYFSQNRCCVPLLTSNFNSLPSLIFWGAFKKFSRENKEDLQVFQHLLLETSCLPRIDIKALTQPCNQEQRISEL